MFVSSRTSVVDAERSGYLSTSTNEQNMERDQAMILGNCSVTITEIAARLGINVVPPWCKHLVQQQFLPQSLGTNGQLKDTHSMPQTGLKLQNDQTPAVLPIIQKIFQYCPSSIPLVHLSRTINSINIRRYV
jgi:hypothetical protein